MLCKAIGLEFTKGVSDKRGEEAGLVICGEKTSPDGLACFAIVEGDSIMLICFNNIISCVVSM